MFCLFFLANFWNGLNWLVVKKGFLYNTRTSYTDT